jgi:hypothetical protein
VVLVQTKCRGDGRDPSLEAGGAPRDGSAASTIYALFGLVAKFLKHIILTFDSLHPFQRSNGRDLGRIDESFHAVAKAISLPYEEDLILKPAYKVGQSDGSKRHWMKT